MTTLEISKLSQPMQKIANEVDASGVSTKDNIIDEKEYNLFQVRVTEELLNTNKISKEDYDAVFGLEISKKTDTNTDSLSYVAEKQQMDKEDAKQSEISRLRTERDRLRKKLYNGKYEEMQNTGSTGGVLFGVAGAIASMVGCVKIGRKLAKKVPSYMPPIYPILGGIFVGAVLGTLSLEFGKEKLPELIKKWDKSDDKYMKQCEQEDPQTYQALQYVEKQLAELEK